MRWEDTSSACSDFVIPEIDWYFPDKSPVNDSRTGRTVFSSLMLSSSLILEFNGNPSRDRAILILVEMTSSLAKFPILFFSSFQLLEG